MMCVSRTSWGCDSGSQEATLKERPTWKFLFPWGEKRPSGEGGARAVRDAGYSALLAQLAVLRAAQDGLHDAGPEEAVADPARRLLSGHSQEARTR